MSPLPTSFWDDTEPEPFDPDELECGWYMAQARVLDFTTVRGASYFPVLVVLTQGGGMMFHATTTVVKRSIPGVVRMRGRVFRPELTETGIEGKWAESDPMVRRHISFTNLTRIEEPPDGSEDAFAYLSTFPSSVYT